MGCSNCSPLDGTYACTWRETLSGGVCLWRAEFSKTLGDCGTLDFHLNLKLSAGWFYLELQKQSPQVNWVQWTKYVGDPVDCTATQTLPRSYSSGQCSTMNAAIIN